MYPFFQQYKLDHVLTSSEHYTMNLYKIFRNHSLGTTVVLGEKEFRELVRSEFPFYFYRVGLLPEYGFYVCNNEKVQSLSIQSDFGGHIYLLILRNLLLDCNVRSHVLDFRYRVVHL